MWLPAARSNRPANVSVTGTESSEVEALLKLQDAPLLGGASTCAALIQNTVRLKQSPLCLSCQQQHVPHCLPSIISLEVRITTGTSGTFTGSGVTAGAEKNLSKGTNPSESNSQVT